jgi:hypothetical protein
VKTFLEFNIVRGKVYKKAQAVEDEEDWKGLLDWENKKQKKK